MSDAVKQAMDGVYAALHADNQGIDKAIEALRVALAAKGEKIAVFKKDKLAQNNRQGRKMMQTYFRKRGVIVEFEEEKSDAA